MIIKRLNLLLASLIILFSLGSCASYIELPVKIPAGKDLSSIKTLAIGDIQFNQYPSINLSQNSSHWRVSKKAKLSEEQKTLFRSALLSQLAAVAPYDIVDLQTYNESQQKRFRDLRPVTGFKVKQVDAVLNGVIVFQMIQQKGHEKAVRSFRRTKRVKSGKRWITAVNSRNEKIVALPYESETASLVAHIELVDTKSGNSNVKRAFSIPLVQSSIIGGTKFPPYEQKRNELKNGQSPEDVLPLWKLNHEIHQEAPLSIKLLANRLAVKISANLLPQISSYIKKEDREIDNGGDQISINYIRAGALYHARKRLEELTGTEDGRTGANLYHLGICYEFLGEFPIAYQTYEEALKTDTGNDLYMSALGRTEKLITLKRK